MKRSRRETEAISGANAKKTGCRGNLGCALFSLPFFLGGAIAIYFLGLYPALKVFRASSWEPIPCVVTSSKVASSSDGDTFAVEIRYSYTIEGKQYQGTRYGFFGGYSSGHRSKADVVAQYPAGAAATCYVNPLDPAEAVIARFESLVLSPHRSDLLFGSLSFEASSHQLEAHATGHLERGIGNDRCRLSRTGKPVHK